MKLILRLVSIVALIGSVLHLSCKKEMPCENCINGNKPPISIAGPDRIITLPTDSVSLDGSSSSDPDGTISSYLWTKISGPVSFTISNSSAKNTVVKSLVVGTYQFELKVTDNGGLSAKDTIRIIVDAVLTSNHSPIANAGVDTMITLPVNSINLNGSQSSDPENNITGYAWTKIFGPSSFNITNANIAQTQAINLIQGVYQFELKVTDSGGLFSKDTIQVIVNATASNNLPPVAIAGLDQIVFLPQDTAVLNGTLSFDPEGGIIKYFWSKLSGPTILGPTNIEHADSSVLTIKFITIGEYIFQLQVTDDKGIISRDTVIVILKNNPAPTRIVKARVLEYGTDLPLAGAMLKVCTSPRSYNSCAANYLNLVTNTNGECFFEANQFRYGWVDKVGYFQNGLLTPCFITYFKNGIQLPESIDGGMAESDSFIIKVVPKINFTLHVKDSSGRGSASLVGDVSFDCFISTGILEASLRPGIDTTFQLVNYWGNTNYWLRVGKNYDSECSCFETGFYTQTIYISKGTNIINITY